MFDTSLRPVIDPALNWVAGGCIAVGLTANGLTILGFIFGLFCAFLWRQAFSARPYLSDIKPAF